jgi:hypothetical protein
VTRSRFSDAKRLKAYAGAAPITRVSGKARSVTRCVYVTTLLMVTGFALLSRLTQIAPPSAPPLPWSAWPL